jgi:hypothetical protein
MHKILKYCAILLALFVVALAPAAAADVLYAGNSDFLIYPSLLVGNDTTHNVQFVDMYNSLWTGPSAALEAEALATINSLDGTGGFYEYDVVFYDMGEVWHYPFGNYDKNGSYVGVGAYELAANDDVVFVALRSAGYPSSNLLDQPFAIIDDEYLTSQGDFFNSSTAPTQSYLLDFFNQGFYDPYDFFFEGTRDQAESFIDYVSSIPYI